MFVKSSHLLLDKIRAQYLGLFRIASIKTYCYKMYTTLIRQNQGHSMWICYKTHFTVQDTFCLLLSQATEHTHTHTHTQLMGNQLPEAEGFVSEHQG